MAAPAKKKEFNRFDEEARKKYIQALERGSQKFKAARISGVSYRTVQRRRENDPEFCILEEYAIAEAREEVEDMLFSLAKQGDLKAIGMWLTAHDRGTYGKQDSRITIDATDNALKLSANQARSRIAELSLTLAERRLALEADNDIIDAEIIE